MSQEIELQEFDYTLAEKSDPSNLETRDIIKKTGIQTVNDAIQSDNYDSGVSGWRLVSTGDFEGNSGTFRGSIVAGDVTLDTTGFVKGGQTGYDSGTGFFLGYDDTWAVSIGVDSGNKMTYKSGTLTVVGTISATATVNAPIVRSFISGTTSDSTPKAVYIKSPPVNSVNFNSADSEHLQILDASQTNLDLTGDLTLEGHFNLDSTGGMSLISKWNATGNQRAYNFVADTELSLAVSSDGTEGAGQYLEFRTSNAAITTGSWNHYSVTLDISTETAIFYKNDTQLTSAINSGTGLGATLHNSTAPFRLGGRESGGIVGLRIDGKAKDVRVWQTIRTATQIAKSNSIEIDGTDTNLVGYWRLEGTDYTDYSISGNTLTAVGTPNADTSIPTFTSSLLQTQSDTTGTSKGFIGFTSDSGEYGDTFRVVISGIVSGFTGLTQGSNYFLSDTFGGISTTEGSVTRRVGIAPSTTELLITNIWST